MERGGSQLDADPHASNAGAVRPVRHARMQMPGLTGRITAPYRLVCAWPVLQPGAENDRPEPRQRGSEKAPPTQGEGGAVVLMESRERVDHSWDIQSTFVQ